MLEWQGVRSSRSSGRFAAHHGGAPGVPGGSAERPGWWSRLVTWRGSWAAPHHGFGPPCHQAGCHCYGQVHGGYGGNGKASVGELGWPREEREGLSSRCASLAFRAFWYLRRDGGRKVQGGEGALSSLWNLHPKKAQVWARTKQGSWPGLRIGDGHRRLVSWLVPLPHLRVGLEGGTGQGEVGETWGRWSRRSVLNNALVRTGVKINTYSPYHRLPLSNSPATTISATWPRLGGNLDRSQTGPMMTFGTGSSKLPYWWSGPEVSSEVSWNLLGLQVILVCKSLGNPIGPFQDLFMRLLVEPALLPRLRGSPMSMPLPSERLSFLSSVEWVLRSPELAVGRASVAPFT